MLYTFVLTALGARSFKITLNLFVYALTCMQNIIKTVSNYCAIHAIESIQMLATSSTTTGEWPSD